MAEYLATVRARLSSQDIIGWTDRGKQFDEILDSSQFGSCETRKSSQSGERRT